MKEKKKLQHHHLIDGKYLKEDCIANLYTQLEELVAPVLHDKLAELLRSFEDECVEYDRSKLYIEKNSKEYTDYIRSLGANT
jgi:hypothetical protein